MSVPVTEIENATGLTKEVIRKWESRYGFPSPGRDDNGDRLYPADQVANLRLIRRLLDAGMRPSKVVGLARLELEALAEKASLVCRAELGDFEGAVVAALCNHDLTGMTQLLHGEVHRQGLLAFVSDILPRLNALIGDAWLRGDVKVFEEHLYAQTVQDLLQGAMPTISAPQGAPRILLTTAPGEIHTLGLLMARTVLTLSGAACVMLGPQTPIPEIADAVIALDIDIVGLSFSISQPTRTIMRFLRDLRDRLGPSVSIWAGGMGAARLTKLVPGVTATTSFDIARNTLHAFRLKRSSVADLD
jgi:DNA-binding transcriptional MerR regulator/methylmalonyl-CoA mutase cobalamin-binding subunit